MAGYRSKRQRSGKLSTWRANVPRDTTSQEGYDEWVKHTADCRYYQNRYDSHIYNRVDTQGCNCPCHTAKGRLRVERD